MKAYYRPVNSGRHYYLCKIIDKNGTLISSSRTKYWEKKERVDIRLAFYMLKLGIIENSRKYRTRRYILKGVVREFLLDLSYMPMITKGRVVGQDLPRYYWEAVVWENFDVTLGITPESTILFTARKGDIGPLLREVRSKLIREQNKNINRIYEKLGPF